MFDIDKWKEVYAVLSKNKVRTFLTAFGVFWGIFMLIIMLGSGNGMQNGIKSNMRNFATNSFFMWTRRTGISYKGYPAGRRFSFDNADIAAIRKVPGVQYVCPQGSLGGHWTSNNVSRNGKIGAFQVKGEIPDFIAVDPLDITSGRFVNDIDIKNKRKVAVIGSAVVSVLFDKSENPIGKYITIQGVSFQVVGVFTAISSDEDETRNVYIPFSTFQQAFNSLDVVSFFSVTSQPGVQVSKTQAKVLKLMAQLHDVSPKDKRAFGSYNLQINFDKLTGLFTGIRILIWIVGAGTLLSGIIGISNIMLIIVKERTKEIGIRRAIGASPKSIISQILLETLTLTFVAGYFGLVAGVGVLQFANHFLAASKTFQNPGVDISVAIKALVLLVVCGGIAGLLPAYRSISIKPVEALRTE